MGLKSGLKSYFKPAAPSPKERGPSVLDTLPRFPRNPPPPSATPSHRSSAPSVAGSTRSGLKGIGKFQNELMASFVYQQQWGRAWLRDRARHNEGVVVRKDRETYTSCPSGLVEQPFGAAVAGLGCAAAMTVHSLVVNSYLDHSPNAVDIPLKGGLRLQIIPSVADLPRARKYHFAAYCTAESLLVVWQDDVAKLVGHAERIENDLMEMAWEADQEDSETKSMLGGPVAEVDEESGRVKPQERRTKLYNTFLVSITLVIIVVVLGAGFRQLAIEIAVDHSYLRLAFGALTPIQIFFTLFFAQVIVGCIAQIIGPVRQMTQNSKFYSADTSPRLPRADLPHITIQCPVYKESLHGVIAPTVRSLKEAISTYELQGGSANMFINDDGLQLISEADRKDRINYYTDNNISWSARPRDGDNGFVRRGKFKKASNMNYGLMLSCKVEDKLKRFERPADWTQDDEAGLYERCLKEVLEEMDGIAWADGNIRIGDYILLVDSDTRVPADCLLDAASEMEQSPDVGILQFSSGVMQVAHDFFENGITFFTNLIYTAIKYTVSNGDVAPFVGHNAILRWSAIQQVCYMDEDGYEKFWSEAHVSEDFDMSLRLQCEGFIIRLATWAHEGFKEGVSLTVYDELARWEKYAYGCNELLFNPIMRWPTRGPFTKLFRVFLFSNIRFTSKITIISYIGTYYAIGAAWILTTVNYFAMGWFNGYLDKYYIDSWKVWFSIVIVFNGLGNIGLASMRFRTNHGSILSNLLLNFKWTLLLAIFLGGLSLHVSAALMAHMLGFNMVWGATAKEVEQSNFFIEVPKVIKRFAFSISFALTMILGMMILAWFPLIPIDWQIRDLVAILPMATVSVSHLLLPICLNPALMTFSW